MKKNPLEVFCLIILTSFIATSLGLAQDYSLPLYTDKIPNSLGTDQVEKSEKKDIEIISNVQIPDIAVYLPTKRFSTGQAVIICPGGGYGVLAYDLEGTDIAKYLNSIGVAGIVLKYRLPSPDTSVIPHKTPLLDAKRAMRLVRHNAKQWNIDPTKIGIMGFSAGGHLASSLGTHFDAGLADATDLVERESCRPDFMILIYPVITLINPSAHSGSREALLGKNPSLDLVKYYSSELQVKDDTPPTFLVHADNDTGVPVENSLLMYAALRKKNIPAEMHILSEGGHGFGLGTNNSHIASWNENLKLWLYSLNNKP
jgi:acetyl esterase/lipase